MLQESCNNDWGGNPNQNIFFLNFFLIFSGHYVTGSISVINMKKSRTRGWTGKVDIQKICSHKQDVAQIIESKSEKNWW